MVDHSPVRCAASLVLPAAVGHLAGPSRPRAPRGQPVGVLVAWVGGVSAGPLDAAARVRLGQLEQLLDQVEVGDRAALALPSVPAPRRRPLVDVPHAELAVADYSSMRLLVVAGASPFRSSTIRPSSAQTTPHPPGPGFGSAEPSVNTPVMPAAPGSARPISLRGPGASRRLRPLARRTLRAQRPAAAWCAAAATGRSAPWSPRRPRP